MQLGFKYIPLQDQAQQSIATKAYFAAPQEYAVFTGVTAIIGKNPMDTFAFTLVDGLDTSMLSGPQLTEMLRSTRPLQLRFGP